MRQLSVSIFVTAVLVFLSSCTFSLPAATPQQIAAAGGYGSPPTGDWRSVAKAWFLKELKDPFSAQYQFSEPTPGYAWWEGHFFVGWEVLVQVNAKNSFGAYIGFQPYLLLFRNNHLLVVFRPGNPWTLQKVTGSSTFTAGEEGPVPVSR